jgi:hypothetical protein
VCSGSLSSRGGTTFGMGGRVGKRGGMTVALEVVLDLDLDLCLDADLDLGSEVLDDSRIPP